MKIRPLALLGLLALISWGEVSAAAGQVHARLFSIRYRPPGDAALLVEPLLSAAGSYTLQPRLHALTVQDTDEVLVRVAEVLRQFDVPPRNVVLTVSLLLGSRLPPAGAPLPVEIRGITDALSDMTRWTNYRLLDSVSITGVEGDAAIRTLAGEGGVRDMYRLRLVVDQVDEERGFIKIKPFTIERSVAQGPAPGAPPASGTVQQREPAWQPIYSTTVNLRNDRPLTVGATRTEKSDTAVFLTIRGKVIE